MTGADTVTSMPTWLSDRIGAAQTIAATLALPTAEEELWRYSRIKELQLAKYTARAGYRSSASSMSVELGSQAESAGITATPLHELASGDVIGSLVTDDSDAFATLSWAHLSDGVLIDIPANAVVHEPIRIEHIIQQSGVIVGTRIVVRVGSNADVTIIERSRSGEQSAVVIPVVEFDLAPSARLRFVSVQQFGTHVWQIGLQSARTAQDATLRVMNVGLGGDYARVRTDAEIVGRGGHNELMAVYFGEGSQMHDFRTQQIHTAQKTTSDLLFKGAVEDQSKSVYSGLIKIGEDARGTVANQTNRNLLLSSEASAESVPNLEIENNDVKCSHASAVGPIDEDHRYYLQSRGVPPEAADRLIVLGFFADLLDRIPDETLRAELHDAVAEKFERRSHR